MDRAALNDYPIGRYDVTVTISDLRAGPRDRLDGPRAIRRQTRPRLRLHPRAGSTAGPSSPRTTTGPASTRRGGTPDLPVISEGACGRPSASWPARWPPAPPARRPEGAPGPRGRRQCRPGSHPRRWGARPRRREMDGDIVIRDGTVVVDGTGAHRDARPTSPSRGAGSSPSARACRAAPRARRGGPGGGTRVHRHSHPLRRPGVLGPAAHAVDASTA